MADILEFFPESIVGGPPRDSQVAALRAIQGAIEGGFKTIILEAPTGTGKTAIAKCIADWRESSKTFILTATGMLQDQYLRDFPGACTYKGSTYFKCLCPDEDQPAGRDPISCSISSKVNDPQGYCWKKLKRDPIAGKVQEVYCPYSIQKMEAMKSKVVVFNYMSYLAARMAEMFGESDFLVLDEAHKAENMLMEWCGINLSARWADYLGLAEVMRRMHGMPIEAGATLLRDVCLTSLMGEDERSLTIKEARVKDGIASLAQKCGYILANPDGWVKQKHKDGKGIAFKPVFVNNYAEWLDNRGVRLLMSATVNESVTTKALGLNRENVAFFRVSSPFDPKNRPVLAGFGLDLSYNKIEASKEILPNILMYILNRHHSHKGVIHTGNYSIYKLLEERLKAEYGDRLLFLPQGDKQLREEMMYEHHHSDRPTVLTSPGLVEGIDLRDELGRFQVICKVPFLALGDEQVKARKKVDGDWYTYQAAAALVQASGRCVRSIDDRAVTYVIDRAIQWLVRSTDGNNQPLIPEWYSEAVDAAGTGNELGPEFLS